MSATGKWFNAVHYGVSPDSGRVDMEEVRRLALEHRPKLLFCGGTAVPRTIDFEAFATIAKEVDALMVADVSHIAGLIAGGAHPSPAPHADVIMTTTHKTLRGPRGAILMCREQHAKAIDRAVFPGLQGGPHQHQTAAIAVALGEASTPAFSEYAHQMVANAKALADALSERGFTLVSGGTDNHLILIDMTSKGLTGKEASTALSSGGDRDERERDPVRSTQAVRPVGHSDRHPRRDLARAARRAHGRDRPLAGRGRRGGARRW